MISRLPFFTLAALGLGFAAACGSDNGPTNPGGDLPSITINTTAGPVYVALGPEPSVISGADPQSTTTWDVAFTSEPAVLVNGGASGPGSDRAVCLCVNESLSLDQVKALSAADGAAAFSSVTSADIPVDSFFKADAESHAISGWYAYDPGTHAIAPTGSVFGLRLASTSGGYAKLHVTALGSPTQANAGQVTLEWAVQPTSAGTLGADQQAVADLSGGGRIYVNLTTGDTSSTEPAAWDIALQGYTIYVNGGVSGSGDVAAVLLVPSSFYTSYASITNIPVGAAGIPANAFETDGAGGAFLTDLPYRYDPTVHQVYPTYDVYLVKRGTDVYKVQIAGYYGTDGTFGQLTVRAAKLVE
ncbi:MAG TPA: HmuY family protein [Gemmatimonadaceae bacterium]|nr:HmuY family protein [Gemmatimonadaceae bacterium]